MFARLWWKEARQFWPIWVLLVLTAAVVQGLALYYEYEAADVRNGALALVAVFWAGLYAIAVGSAAFAGERETGTLALLDTLPVSRRLLWGSKTSFALVSTLGLAVVLVLMSLVGTKTWATGNIGVAWYAIGCAVILFEAVAWGLVWSAGLRSALGAAVMTLVCVIFGVTVVAAYLDFHMTRYTLGGGDDFIAMIPARVGTAVVSLALSGWLMTRPPRPERLPLMAHWAGVRSRVVLRSPVVLQGFAAVSRRFRKPVGPEVTAVAWQTVRQGFPAWWKLLAFMLLCFWSILYEIQPAAQFLSLIGGALLLMAGVSVFHDDNRNDLHRFLAHHGARPGLVWLVKMGVWACGLLAIVAIVSVINVLRSPPGARWGGPQSEITAAIASIPIGIFLVGQLCGMVFRRAITAWTVAILLGIAVSTPFTALAFLFLIPLGSILPAVLSLALIGWAWSGDWLFDRPAPGRWVRLGLWALLWVVTWSGTYIGYRLRDVPAQAPIAATANWPQTVPAADNAAVVYDKAFRELVLNITMEHDFGRPLTPYEKANLEANTGPLALVRTASTMASLQLEPPRRTTRFTAYRLSPYWQLSNLLRLSARVRASKGDLEGAWDDLVAALRLSRQLGAAAGVDQAVDALNIERPVLVNMMEWSNVKGQTPARLRKAVAEYRELPPMIRPADVFRNEAQIVEQTLELPTFELEERIKEKRRHDRQDAPASGYELTLLPWERIRARNASRLILADAIDQASHEPWERDYIQMDRQTIIRTRAAGSPLPPGAVANQFAGTIIKGGRLGQSTAYPVPPQTRVGQLPSYDPRVLPSAYIRPEITHGLETTPLLQEIAPQLEPFLTSDELNEVGRRAVVLYLELRIHQLEHGGKAPTPNEWHDRVLSSPELNDPYNGWPFGYVKADGQTAVDPLADALAVGGPIRVSQKPLRDRWLLYSVGPDRMDERANVSMYAMFSPNHGDIIFPLPPEPADAPRGDSAQPGTKPR